MSILQTIVKEILDSDREHILDSVTKAKMAISLNTFVIESIEKFIKGQKEHGGNLVDRDLAKEISQETIDLFWYNEGQKWKQHKNQ